MTARAAHHAFLRLACAAVLLALVSSAAGAGGVPEGRTEIVFWNLFTAGDQQQVITGLVDRFNAGQTAWHVRQVDIPYQHIHQKMLHMVAGGVPPDVSIFDRFLVASFAARGAFRPLDDLVAEAGLKAEDFFEAPWAECFYGGRQYAVPYDTDVRVLYYNKRAFREAGLDPDRPPRTWGDLREASRRLTKRRPDGRFDQVGYHPVWGNLGALYLYGWQKGGQFMSPDGRTVTLNDPRIVEALTWVRDFVAEYGLDNLLTLQTGFGAEAQNPFITGKIAMVILDVGDLSMIQKYGADLEWGAAPCPHPEDGVPATWSGGFAMVVPKGSGHVDGAWAFCRFILSEPSQRTMATASNKLPALRAASDDPFFQQSAFWRLAIDQMKVSHYRPITPVGLTVNTEMYRAVDQVIHGTRTPQAALDEATEASQKVLDQFLAGASGRPVRWPPVIGAILGALGLLVLVRTWVSWRKVRAMHLRRRQAVAGYVFALPAVLGLGLFTLGPVLAALTYSFCHYEILTPASFVGLENYTRLFTEDRFFVKALGNTAYFTVLAVPLGIAMALGLALLLNRRIAGRAVYRTCFYLPTVVPLVAGSLLWAWLFNGEYGLINVVLGYVGLPEVRWLTDPAWAKPALVIMGLWGVGGGMIILLAALQGVPRSLYEAADIDGAGALRQFFAITVPMISPALFFMLVMGVIGSVQVFTQALLMTDGGPVDATLFYVLYLFRQAFEELHMGYASAMAWVLFAFILGLTGLQFLLARRWVYYEGAPR